MATAKKAIKKVHRKKVVRHRKPAMTTSVRHRRKKIGSIGSESLIYGVLGGIAGKFVAKNLSGTTLGLPTSIVPFIVPAAGVAMAMLSKDEKLKDAGKGMLIVGASDLINGYIPAMIKGIPQTVGTTVQNRNFQPKRYYPKMVGATNRRNAPQTIGRKQTLRIAGTNPNMGKGGNRGTSLPMSIGNLYTSF